MTDSEILRRERTGIDRRLFLGGIAASGLAGLGLAPTGLAWAATIPPADRMPFEVTRGGDPIGTHQITFSRQGSRTQVDIAIDLEVSVAFVTVFRYRHRNTEVWEDGRLVAIDTETNDDGRDYRLTGRATAAGLEVDGGQGRYVAPADIMPTSYWNQEIVRRTELLDTQRGGILNVSARPGAVEQLQTGGRTVRAQRYTFTGDLTLSAWYTDVGQWVAMSFDARGEEVRYRLRPDGAVLAG